MLGRPGDLRSQSEHKCADTLGAEGEADRAIVDGEGQVVLEELCPLARALCAGMAVCRVVLRGQWPIRSMQRQVDGEGHVLRDRRRVDEMDAKSVIGTTGGREDTRGQLAVEIDDALAEGGRESFLTAALAVGVTVNPSKSMRLCCQSSDSRWLSSGAYEVIATTSALRSTPVRSSNT